MRREPRTSRMSEAQNHELVECFPVLSCVSCELGRHRKKGQGRVMTPIILPFQERHCQLHSLLLFFVMEGVKAPKEAVGESLCCA